MMTDKIRGWVSFLLILITFALNGQQVGIGEWRDHLPYVHGISVAVTDGRIYGATDYSLFYLIKEDNTLNRLTTIQGLNDVGISKIGYNDRNNTLVIAYSNANIDLIKDNVIINMPDIFNSTAVTPEEKTINGIMFIDDLAYLSCGFGIVVIDLVKEEVKDTYYIGPEGSHLKVFNMTVDQELFFAATETGIFTADKDDPNLAFFGAWTRDLSMPEPEAVYNHIVNNAGTIYVNRYTEVFKEDLIYYYRDGTWYNGQETFGEEDVLDLASHNDQLYVAHGYNMLVFDTAHSVVKTIWTYYTTGPSINEVDFDGQEVWIADGKLGMVKELNENFSFYTPNSPKTADVFDMTIAGQTLWTAAGGRNLSWGNTWKTGSVSSLIDDSWSTIDRRTEGAEALDSILDIVCIAVNPFDYAQVFAGSWHLGLAEFRDDNYFQLYTPENSSLEYKANEGPPICKIGGLQFDDAGNLWMTNSGANNILSVKINNGGAGEEWRSFYLGSQSSGKDIGELIIDSYGQKWILWREHSIIVFDDGGTPKDPSDDRVKHLSGAQGNGNLPGTKIFSIVEDLDGEIWIGSDEGIAVIYSPENVFSQYNFDAQRILIPRNDGTGLADILLEFETITDIKVDGNNNKWIGTDRSGVYLVSEDGLREIHHFTTDNSPLFSNNIASLAFNGVSGEVFIGTANGIISYKGSATEGGDTNTDVYAYPNPVRPDYSGPIAIKGLVTNADFKVTDINGNLVYSGKAEGGQAIWYGTNFDGRRAMSGVYLVFVTDSNGEETLVTKILFMN
jgi:ligand-binding sensor domain-containing protein